MLFDKSMVESDLSILFLLEKPFQKNLSVWWVDQLFPQKTKIENINLFDSISCDLC